ncbi:MFS transporter permease [Rhizobacter sp. AJA081-3]|jgi:hypothetical protein|uniref:DUF6064 family protein n=1 Tax=Rhizobacter sp. AJA081-3 TaxID=2753607 RepID=UPI001AE0B18E|nr:DUF6064 family protein [Rhizobacter sp. AJA081-3]QTN22015.1 MFS transporter permease [Rhizobacter sp. AJA081-3]
MSEWWTYRLSDFLLFSPRTWFRLIELYNAWLWPAQPLVLGLGLGLLVAMWRGLPWAPRASCVALAIAWAWVAWAFHLQRYAAINWAATWFAAAFAVQSVLMLALAWRLAPGPARRSPTGFALLVGAVTLMPLLGVACGRPWQEAEVFGLTPDATVLGTLGVLLLLGDTPRPFGAGVWLVPLIWCGVGGATLLAMGLPQSVLLPLAGLVAAMTRLARD